VSNASVTLLLYPINNLQLYPDIA